MGLIKTINSPLVIGDEVAASDLDQTFQSILDDIIYEYAALIADVEDKKVDANYLKTEIEKRIANQKNIYDPELIKKQVLNAIYGYGILEPYIKDLTLSDIDGTRYDYFVAKRNGVVERLPVSFASEREFEQFCRVMIVRHGGMINTRDSQCRVSDRFNKLRINVCISPRNTTGTSINIRRHTEHAFTYAQLVSLNFLDDSSRAIIEALHKDKRSILICGKGGSGKTTLLRCLVDTNNLYERMLICESDTEIYPQNKNAIVQQALKKMSSNDENPLERIVREGLTMSLDTYCIGEITGAESWPFVKAGHTGHRIMATVHSNSCKDALNRLLMLVENETKIDTELLTHIVADSIDNIVFIRDFRVVEIVEVIAFGVIKQLYNIDVKAGEECS